ncbi:hypothetical protein [Fibrobacter sp.]|uniref:hypothetical protein n=1 Tax=Fibrobacter sp. TaxID=35828 RepID=UPI00388EF68B
MKISKYLLTLALGVAVFGAVACSDDSSSTAPANDEKKSTGTWDDVQIFDAKANLPSCDKFDGVAQVVDEKAFFACVEGEWEQINVSAPAYEQLPECTAPLNDFCIDISNGDEIQQSYVCDEGEWVKAIRVEGGGCAEGYVNGIAVEDWELGIWEYE